MRKLWVGTSTVALAVSTVAVGVLGQGGADAAPPRAKVTVTIQAEQVDLSGTVSSAKPSQCAADRTVYVYEQIGGRGGGDDEKRYSDTTSKQNGKYVWDIGNTGEEGYFYAVVLAKPGCKGAASKTVHAVRAEE